MGWMFRVAKGTLWISMLRGTRVPANAQNGGKKDTADDREAGYRALVRDVVLGGLAVIVLSLAVPAWIIGVEYSKTYGTVLGRGSPPVAEVLRERALDTVVVTPRLPRVLELAEQIVRRETERRESERREAERRQKIARREAARRNATDSITDHTDVPVDHAAAQPVKIVSPAVNTPQFDFRDSVQGP
jgi:hypothetical protein